MKTKITLGLFLLITAHAFAVKTVYFNGKPYKVYPHYVDLYRGQIGSARLDFYNFKLKNLNVPPTIGEYEDGEYIMYSTSHDLKFKRKEGRYKLYDTIFHIFATFVLKNSQKNGPLNLYDLKDNSKPYLTIPYVNDMVDGELYFKELAGSKSEYRRSPNSNRARLNVAYDFYKMRFKEGVVNGLQEHFYLTHSGDTVLFRYVNFSKGNKSGWYVRLYLDMVKKNIIRIGYDSIFYVNDKEHGVSVNKYKDEFTYSYYDHGEENGFRIYENGKLKVLRLDFVDSIANYIPGYQSEKTLPRAGSFKSNEGFVYVNYRNPDFAYLTFAKGNQVRQNFYKYYSYYHDTTINGQLLIYEKNLTYRNTKKNEMLFTFYRLDTCLFIDKHHSDSSILEYCRIQQFVQYRHGNQVVKTHYLPDYFKTYKDSLNPILIERVKGDEVDIVKYYHPAFKLSFWDIDYHAGKMAGCKEYYKFKGGAANGRVIHYFQMPFNGDTLYCADTLINNGQQLYTQDYAFNAYILNYLELDTSRTVHKKSVNSGLFNIQFYNFFMPYPNRHVSISVGKKPFTGWFNINLVYKKKAKSIKGGVYLANSLLANLTKEEFIEIDLELDESYLDVPVSSYFAIPAKRYYVYLNRGHFSGYCGLINRSSYLTYQMFYDQNKISSDISIKVYSLNKKYMYKEHVDRDFFIGHYVSKIVRFEDQNVVLKPTPSMMYIQGKKDGQWVIPDGDYSVNETYRNGKRNGHVYEYDTETSENRNDYTYLNMLYQMTNDTVNGEVWNLNMNGYPDYYGKFNMGVPDGYFYLYGSDTLNGNFLQRIHFNKGYLDEQMLEYRDSGSLKSSIDFNLKDSIYKDVFSIRSYNEYISTSALYKEVNSRYGDYMKSPSTVYNPKDFMSHIFSTGNFEKGYYRYYYKSGTLFAEGEKVREEPNGLWKFYREDGKSLYKTIEFVDTIIKMGFEDSIEAYAYVKTYYEDGKLMFEGWATDRSSKYSCESETELPTEEDYYIKFYDTLGNRMPIEDSCYIVEYQVNGYKLKEGLMINGKKSGIWVYYSRYGLPTEIGRYVNGKKEGRWLKGDLSGLNLNENICFMSSEEFMAWIRMYGGNLSLKEMYFENGKFLMSDSVETVKQ